MFALEALLTLAGRRCPRRDAIRPRQSLPRRRCLPRVADYPQDATRLMPPEQEVHATTSTPETTDEARQLEPLDAIVFTDEG